MDFLTWTFTILGIGVSLIPMLFAFFQYLNTRGNPKARVIKRSISWGIGSLAVLYLTGILFWVEPKSDSKDIHADIQQIKEEIQEYRESNGIIGIPVSSSDKRAKVELSAEIQEKLVKLSQYEKAGIPIDPEIYVEEGLLFSNEENYEKAIEKFKVAITLKPNYEFAYFLSGNSFFSIGQLDSSLHYSTVAAELAKKEKKRQIEADAYNTIGLAYRNKKELEKALLFHQQALDIYREISYSRGEASALNDIGLVYASKKDFPKAIEFHEKALVLHRINGNKQGECNALLNIGLYYQNKNDLQKALEYFQKSLDLAQKNDLHLREGGACINIGVIHYNLNEMDKALEYYDRALDVAQRHKLPTVEVMALGNKGNVYQYQGRFRESLDLYFKALSIEKSIKSFSYTSSTHTKIDKREGVTVTRDEINTLSCISYSYTKLGELDNAIRFTKEILQIDSTAAIGYYNLACLYSLLDSTETAIDYLFRGRKYFSKGLIQGSKIDHDLDNIRSDPRFKKIMYAEQ